MDFLVDDGGFFVIFGIVMIKFEIEQFRVIFVVKIMIFDFSFECKVIMIDVIKELFVEGLKYLIMKIVDVGWDNMDFFMSFIQSVLLY